MPRIEIDTVIEAPLEVVFDMARSIDLHLESTKHTGERAIAGKTSGHLEMGEWVTWRAKHLGFYQELTSKISAYERPKYFVDEMIEGAFKSFRHEHHFESVSPSTTLMKDVFDYESPLGWLGRIADSIFLEQYMFKFLIERNRVLKEAAEMG